MAHTGNFTDGYISKSAWGWHWVGREVDKFNGSGQYKSVQGFKVIAFDSEAEALADMQKNCPDCKLITEAEFKAEGDRRLVEHRAAIQANKDSNNGRLTKFVRKYS